MPTITRSDTARGFGRASRAPQFLQPINPLSFLGVAPEIRIYVYKLLFVMAYMYVGCDFHSKLKISRKAFSCAILSVCRQVHQEAWPVLRSCLELDLWLSNEMFTRIPPRVEQNILPYVQTISFQQSGRVVIDASKVETFLHNLPLLRNLCLDTSFLHIYGSLRSIYEAMVNVQCSWRSSGGITGFDYYDNFLVQNSLRAHGLANGHIGATPAHRTNEYTNESGVAKFGSGIRCTVRGDVSESHPGQYYRYAEIAITFNLYTLEVLTRSISVECGRKITTIRDARVWAFGERGCVLQGETAEQAEIEGRRLLTDLRSRD